ncbi:MAG: trans-sulfuration enzyme family protein [bacterium]
MKPETRAVHAGSEPQKHLGAVSPPIYQTVSFVASDTEELEAINSGQRKGFVYSRLRNPTVMAAEAKIAALEEADSAVVFGSGMAAVDAALSPLLGAGDRLVTLSDIYGGSYQLFHEVLPARGIDVAWAASSDPDAVERLMAGPCKVLFIETPTNPLVRVVDIAAMADLAHRAGARLVVDSTLAGPLVQRPLALGADLVVHSASKYLNGHGDLIAGAVVGSRAMTRAVRAYRHTVGAILDPHAAWLLQRGLSTYPLRMRQQNDNGLYVAGFLARHSKVARVHYPGLGGHAQHDLATRQMSGFGGLLSFEVTGGGAAARTVVDRCRLSAIGPSVGAIESLISQPANTSHFSVPAEIRRQMGISDNLVRLSVGIEAADDICADLAQALEFA